MRKLLQPFRRFDQWLVKNHPHLWATRAHWIISGATAAGLLWLLFMAVSIQIDPERLPRFSSLSNWCLFPLILADLAMLTMLILFLRRGQQALNFKKLFLLAFTLALPLLFCQLSWKVLDWKVLSKVDPASVLKDASLFRTNLLRTNSTEYWTRETEPPPGQEFNQRDALVLMNPDEVRHFLKVVDRYQLDEAEPDENGNFSQHQPFWNEFLLKYLRWHFGEQPVPKAQMRDSLAAFYESPVFQNYIQSEKNLSAEDTTGYLMQLEDVEAFLKKWYVDSLAECTPSFPIYKDGPDDIRPWQWLLENAPVFYFNNYNHPPGLWGAGSWSAFASQKTVVGTEEALLISSWLLWLLFLTCLVIGLMRGLPVFLSVLGLGVIHISICAAVFTNVKTLSGLEQLVFFQTLWGSFAVLALGLWVTTAFMRRSTMFSKVMRGLAFLTAVFLCFGLPNLSKQAHDVEKESMVMWTSFATGFAGLLLLFYLFYYRTQHLPKD